MRRVILLAALSTVVSAGWAMANPVVVTPSNMGNWSLFATQSLSNAQGGHGTADIVTSPADPNVLPDAGSAHLETASGYGDESAQLRDSVDWVGTKLSDLTTLSYDTYITASNGGSPPGTTVSQDTFLNLYLSNGDRLWFEPVFSDASAGNGNSNPQATPVFNTWQNWNLLQGMWYSDNGAGGSGTGSNAITWSAIVAAEGAGVTIVDAPGGLGGIRIAAGFANPGDTFNVYVDNFSIGTKTAGTTTYDFEPDAVVPLPASAWSGLALLGGLGLLGGFKRLRRQMA